MAKMVISAKVQGRGPLADFMSQILAYEIPILAINSDSGAIVTERMPDGKKTCFMTWVQHRLVCLPHVKTTYVLEVGVIQAKAISLFCNNHMAWNVDTYPVFTDQEQLQDK